MTQDSKGRATAAIIREAWEAAEPKATTRGVADKLIDAGYLTSESTVRRCKRAGFAPFSWEIFPVKKPRKAPIAARIASVTEDKPIPEAVADVVVDAINTMSDKDAARLTAILKQDEATIRENLRKLHLACGYMLAEDMANHTRMMMLAPDKAAKLYTALATTVEPPVITVAATPPADGSDARLVEGREITQEVISPSAQAIREFRRKQGIAA